MAKLIIERNSEWNNKVRDILLFIDDEKIGLIKDSETKSFEIGAGSHTVYAKIDWCGSKKFELNIAENDTQKRYLSGFKFGNLIMPLSAIILLAYMGLKLVYSIDIIYLFVFIIPVFLYMVYYLTLGRNEYLILKAEK